MVERSTARASTLASYASTWRNAIAPVLAGQDVTRTTRQDIVRLIPLATLKATPGLEEMMVTKRGSRLSVQPVTEREFDIVSRLGRGTGSRELAP